MACPAALRRVSGYARLSKEASTVTDKLSADERDFIEGFERGEWQSVANLNGEVQAVRAAARQTFNKTKRVDSRGTEKR